MNTPLIDLIVATEVEKSLDRFTKKLFSYDVATNVWVFPSPANEYGMTAELVDAIKQNILDQL